MEFPCFVHPVIEKKKYLSLKTIDMKQINLFKTAKKQERTQCYMTRNVVFDKSIYQRTILSFLFILISISINASITVYGIVTDTNNEIIPGANVTEKGTTNGTITDIDGKYTLVVSSENSVLVFAFIGYKNSEVKVNEQTEINVKLQQEETKLEECVVVGYGTCKHSRLTGAVSSLFRKSPAAPPVFNQQEFNTEAYSSIHENGYKSPINEPLSTFSVDVDRASYSNVRRYLNNGQLPPKDAVRVEEMINYFDYNYKAPENDVPFSINKELGLTPWNKEHYLLKIALKGKETKRENLKGSNLVFLIDVSGSMASTNKLPLLKSAFKLLVNQLSDEDKVAIVVYAGASGVVLPATKGTNKNKILDALEQLSAGGSTAGGEGLKLAYKIAQENFIKNGNNRIIMATDGDFNVGVSSNSEMEQLVTINREKGIAITVLGFGMGNYKDDKLEIIANKGNGNYAYIDNLQEAQKTLVTEFGSTLYTIAKDVKFQLEFNPNLVAAYRLIGYENRLLNKEDFNDDTKDAGEIGSGHVVTALYEIIPHSASDKDEWVKSIGKLKYQQTTTIDKSKLDNELLTVRLRYKEPNGSKSKLITEAIKQNTDELENQSTDFNFASSVAAFGMILRNSEYVNNMSYDNVINLAKKNKGDDEYGYRGEFIRLVKMAQQLNDISLSR